METSLYERKKKVENSFILCILHVLRFSKFSQRRYVYNDYQTVGKKERYLCEERGYTYAFKGDEKID